METRLVGFLGTSEYLTTTYEWEDQRVESRFAPHAIAKLLAARGETPREIVLVCTKEAQQKHTQAVTECLVRDVGVSPRFREIPKGSEPQELWRMFQTLCEEFQEDESHTLVVDITLGFRSQPFFAATVLAFVRAISESVPRTRVVYAGDIQKDRPTQVWEVTRAIEVLDWAHALQLFLKTGRAAPVARLAKPSGRELAKKWAENKQGPRPALDTLGRAIEEFGVDLGTLRTGDLILGRTGSQSSVRRLLDAIQAARPVVEEHLPPLAGVLERLHEMATVLDADDLQSERGRAALAALARTYLDMERYVEAATTIREAWVTLYADPSATRPGPGFNRDKREEAEKVCRRSLGVQKYEDFGQLRNDLNHAGMNHDPRTGDAIIKAVKTEVEKFENADYEQIRSRTVRPSASAVSVFVNLSNHPSSSWAPEQVRAAKDLVGPEGVLVDIPFPALDPTRLDLEYLEKQATMVREQIEQLPGVPTHAMVQGEHTLTTLLVASLQANGVRCYAATTERVVEMAPDGAKISRFAFRGFREFPPLA